jgi:hypothetical protein
MADVEKKNAEKKASEAQAEVPKNDTNSDNVKVEL